MKTIYDGSGIPKTVFSRNFKAFPKSCNECARSLIVGTRKEKGSDFECEYYCCSNENNYIPVAKDVFLSSKPSFCPKNKVIYEEDSYGR